MDQCDTKVGLIKQVWISDLHVYFMVQWFCLIHVYLEDYLMDEGHTWYNGLVWHKDWPHKIYTGQWPIFCVSDHLLNILKNIWWMNIMFVLMGQCDTKIDLLKCMQFSDLYFVVQRFCLISRSYKLKSLLRSGSSCFINHFKLDKH